MNYTYGHALDEVSNGDQAEFTAGSSDFPQDPFHLRGSGFTSPADTITATGSSMTVKSSHRHRDNSQAKPKR